MAEVIRMPRLSDTMEEGNIVAWLKKVGDKVSPGDILAEVETDKATMELESFHEGYLLYISVPSGPVPVNDILAVIGAKDEDYKSLIQSNGTSQPSEKKPEDVQKPQPKSEAEPGKEKPEKTADTESQEHSDQQEGGESAPAEDQSDAPSTKSEGGQRIKSSPLAKSIAAKSGVDLSKVKGSGDGGRIIKRDVEKLASTPQAQTVKATEPAAGGFEDIPLSQMRKTIAKRLAESKFSAPHYYLTMKINMDKVADARKLINDQSGLKISFNDFVVKACAVALKSHPAINSSWMGDKVRVNKDINVGVAVAVDEGLLVPVLFGADKLTLGTINAQINTLADKARQKKLQPQEMQGNTFTISNLGMFGIDEFTAIINPPDAAIMAVGAIADELKLIEGEITVEKTMKITLSCDHRVIDGATGSKFLQTFKQLLENPVAMLV